MEYIVSVESVNICNLIESISTAHFNVIVTTIPTETFVIVM